MDTSAIQARPVAEFTAAEVADAATRSFEGYLVPLRFTPEAYERRFRGEDLDPYASRLYFREGDLVGVMLIARRGWTRRVSAMGFVPAARGQGLGRWALGEVIAEARARGERAVVLEVIEQNTPAVALYTKVGFLPRRRLIGYRCEPGPGSDSPARLQEIDPLEFARIAAREGEPDLPWMLTAETLSAAAPPARAYSLEDRAFALISDPGSERIALAALVVPRSCRRQGWGSRLLQALGAAFPGRPLFVSPIVPEDLAPGFFARLGWERQGLSQLEMRLEI
ncbi:MAG TPA: GNAT family N-acetyltransferase [Thermoanaerobaculia bacterium]|nr:GNAT family N-acetyltransferase [Thermoanaerobaculia bacterium]